MPDPLVMPFANVRHLGFLDKVGAARLAGSLRALLDAANVAY